MDSPLHVGYLIVQAKTSIAPRWCGREGERERASDSSSVPFWILTSPSSPPLLCSWVFSKQLPNPSACLQCPASQTSAKASAKEGLNQHGTKTVDFGTSMLFLRWFLPPISSVKHSPDCSGKGICIFERVCHPLGSGHSLRYAVGHCDPLANERFNAETKSRKKYYIRNKNNSKTYQYLLHQ